MAVRAPLRVLSLQRLSRAQTLSWCVLRPRPAPSPPAASASAYLPPRCRTSAFTLSTAGTRSPKQHLRPVRYGVRSGLWRELWRLQGADPPPGRDGHPLRSRRLPPGFLDSRPVLLCVALPAFKGIRTTAIRAFGACVGAATPDLFAHPTPKTLSRCPRRHAGRKKGWPSWRRRQRCSLPCTRVSCGAPSS